MLATIDNGKPIWDSRVLTCLGYKETWEKNPDGDLAENIYTRICADYEEYESSEQCNKCLKMFDAIFPEYAGCVHKTKKIDFLLWCMGSDIEYLATRIPNRIGLTMTS